ncbi:hypothetical protein M3Y94_00610500 [Aphelenchoides besseyi]|nr:hypothetical protein M3Y94_00610500 [Aphelenchoides besseyi]
MEIEEEVDVNQNIGKGRCVHETPLNDAHNNQSPTNLQQPLITVLPATKPEPIEIVELSDDELDQPVNETTIEETILASKVDHLSSTKNDDDRVAQHLEHTQVPDVVVPTETVNQNENLENEKKEQDEKESIATESTTSSSEESEDSMSEESEYNPPEELEYDLSEESDRSSSTPKIRRSMLESTYHSIISSDDELAQPIKLTARKSVSGSLNSTASKNRRLTKKRLRVEESSDTEEEEKVECKLRRTNSKITITASGKAFEVDKTVLIEESNHFARECAKNDCLTSFNLDWIKKDVLNAVIQWMTNKHVDDLKNQAMKLYEAADKLDMAKLRGQCIESLKETCKTGNQAAHYIFAVKHNITDLQHEMDFIKRAPTKMAAFLNTPEMIKLIKDKETDLILKINKSFLKD